MRRSPRGRPARNRSDVAWLPSGRVGAGHEGMGAASQLPGYEDVVAVASGGQARYHDTEMLQRWYGDWDPEAFDLEAARRRFDR